MHGVLQIFIFFQQMERRKKHGGRKNKKTKLIQNTHNPIPQTLLQVEVEESHFKPNISEPNLRYDRSLESETGSECESVPGAETIPEIGLNNNSGSGGSLGARLKEEAWEFIKGECFLRDSIRPDTVAVWLRYRTFK